MIGTVREFAKAEGLHWTRVYLYIREGRFEERFPKAQLMKKTVTKGLLSHEEYEIEW